MYFSLEMTLGSKLLTYAFLFNVLCFRALFDFHANEHDTTVLRIAFVRLCKALHFLSEIGL